MSIEKIINQWEDKHSELLSEYQTQSMEEKNYHYLPVLRREMKTILDFIKDLKQINKIKGNIVDADMYKECFEIFIPTEKWDEATEFLSTYGSGLAKELLKKEK